MNWLDDLLSAGLASRVDDADGAVVPLEEAFRFSGGQLQWGSNEARRLSPPRERELGADSVDVPFKTTEWAEKVVAFFEELELADQPILVAVEFADFTVIEVNLRDIDAVLRLLANVPAHKYFFPKDASWCVHWSFEDEVVFGGPE